MTMNAHVPATLSAGGQVMAIVPQTFEETMRVSRAVVASGLAPSALIGKLTGDDAAAAVAVAIMSGAELGLKPMVSLRSFTVINGKPALYGDGLINVVRMSGKVAYLRTGCDEVNGKLIGYCEAKRSDTGEEKRVEFSQDDATRARLWDDRATVKKQVWENGQKVWRDNVPNDAPWYRFPKRMLAWRAAGYCLRELFGDVLGGIRDEFEAREIAEAEGMRDITPPAETENKPTPPKPPKPPAPPSSTTIDAEPARDGQPAESDFDLGGYLEEIETALAGAKDEASVEEIWNDFDAPATLETEGHADMIETAFAIKTRRLALLSPLNGG
ncbi:phage recombination protein Bet [Pseudorhizobium endolithicum]|uniref:Phage recombination protein Bet n=1 Tax=Pseudorhizobium endolithicum TaxID=1191678 RepID=A0ABN7JEE6_9HYPH|nr:recombinase RecT [Pseudorhizobium endolithicum]CAD7023295.1 phage recombination protein Bet [Pseudorhizobium endolithicum]